MSSDDPPASHPAVAARPTVATRPPPAGGGIAFHRQRVVVAAEYSDGPLPSGRELKRYREADPSAPRIILQEFRAESRHRRHMEPEVVTGETRRADRGQVFALVVMLVGLSFSALLIQGGHDWAGGIIGGIDLLGMAALFLTAGTGSRDHEPAKGPQPKHAAE
jgi:hypothetical protein